jgi:SNF2 family DNA or RNA helicase
VPSKLIILSFQVGYGKTAITLGLIDLAEKAPPIPEDYRSGHIETGATLVVVPAHLMGQWPAEIQKFLGTSKTVVVIKDLSCLNKITVKQIVDADIVVVNFTVLSNEKYFSRLSRLAGAATATVPKGRHFETVYDGFLKGLTVRVAQIKEDTKNVFSKIQNDAKNRENRDGCEGGVRLDGKKAVYKEGEKAKVHEQVEKASIKDVADPWLLSKQAKQNYEKMTCPNLEMFFWRRLVVDEFTYLANEKRGQTLSLILGLKAHARWGLSGTPAHANFNDIQSLATLLGIHLGVEESLPGARKRGKEEKTGLEALSNFLELRTMQWHERRHSLAQKFLDRFVRQNIAEIDEIPYEEHLEFIELPPAERAIYLELDTHLRSLDMKSKSAQRSKKRSTGDRENRMQQVLEESKSAEEALLKRCAHFNMSGSNSTTAMEKCDEIIKLREKQNTVCEEDLVDSIAAALKQRNLILELDPGWLGTKSTEKGEVQDRLEVYLRDVENLSSISGGADFEIHSRIKHLLAQAHESKDPVKQYPKLAEANGEIADEDDDSSENGSEAEDGSKKRKRTEPTPEKKLYDMKFGLREHMHLVTALGKELCGRIRSLRYFQWVRKFQHQQTSMECPSCSSVLSIDRVGVLSSCGHIGCLDCLHRCAADCHCVANKCSISCQARVASTQIVSAVNLGADQDHSHAGKYGAKLTAVVNKVREVITSGDRLIVFVQFDDLKEKIKEALTDEGIPSLEITGNIRKMIKAVEPFQKTKPGKNDPRVLLLKMDDEQSAGLNLTNLNHAIFVHPLLAPTKQAYRAYETQAVGRIRRFGQSKTVHVWRFLVTNSIDTEIYDDRAGTQGGA